MRSTMGPLKIIAAGVRTAMRLQRRAPSSVSLRAVSGAQARVEAALNELRGLVRPNRKGQRPVEILEAVVHTLTEPQVPVVWPCDRVIVDPSSLFIRSVMMDHASDATLALQGVRALVRILRCSARDLLVGTGGTKLHAASALRAACAACTCGDHGLAIALALPLVDAGERRLVLGAYGEPPEHLVGDPDGEAAAILCVALRASKRHAEAAMWERAVKRAWRRAPASGNPILYERTLKELLGGTRVAPPEDDDLPRGFTLRQIIEAAFSPRPNSDDIQGSSTWERKVDEAIHLIENMRELHKHRTMKSRGKWIYQSYNSVLGIALEVGAIALSQKEVAATKLGEMTPRRGDGLPSRRWAEGT